MKIKQTLNKKALALAITSFLLGTLILLLFLVSKSEAFLIGGAFFVIIAVVLNAITLIQLFANSIINYQYYRENLITMLLFIVNIPIAIGYLLVAMNTSF